jgi:hypothetical protein
VGRAETSETFPTGGPARPTEDAAAAEVREPRRRSRQLRGASLQWAGTESWYGSGPPGVSTWG